VPQAHRCSNKRATALGIKILLVAGTVLDSERPGSRCFRARNSSVRRCVNLGRGFARRRYDKLVMPGGFTATVTYTTAWDAVADIVKVVPADFTGRRISGVLKLRCHRSP